MHLQRSRSDQLVRKIIYCQYVRHFFQWHRPIIPIRRGLSVRLTAVVIRLMTVVEFGGNSSSRSAGRFNRELPTTRRIFRPRFKHTPKIASQNNSVNISDGYSNTVYLLCISTSFAGSFPRTRSSTRKLKRSARRVKDIISFMINDRSELKLACSKVFKISTGANYGNVEEQVTVM